MTVGVVIPCRNEVRWIRDLLDALRAQDRQPDEIVVVDDGSSDGTADAVGQWRQEHAGMPVRVVPGRGRGVAAAVNTGIAELTTEAVVRLDGHCRPAADYVRRTVELLDQPSVGVAGGAWTIQPGAQTIEARAIAIAGQHPLGSGGALYRSAPVASAKLQVASCDVDTVPFGAFRRDLWKELGGLDERLYTNEDYDFNFRVRDRGLRVMLDPSIRCTYYARPTIGTLARQYTRYGWWKARMLMLHPRSLRWRQAIPILLVPGLVVSPFVSVWFLVAYPVLVVVGALHAAVTRRDLAAAPWIAAAFFTIQLAWSAGIWASVLSGGRSALGARRPGVTS
jgi:GT2 family glycosyltransferase